MFATPRYVVKGGELVVEEGQLRQAPAGRRLHVRPEYDRGGGGAVYEASSTAHAAVSFSNYPVDVLRDAPVPVAGR